MKIKPKFIAIVSSILLIFVFSFSIINFNAKTTQTSATTLSNKKIGWGIKRNNNHEQPDLGSYNKRVIDSYEGIAMGSKDQKYVYLTFDNGYEAGYMPKILATLKENSVPATFFITVNHKSMPDLTNEQIQKEVMNLHTAIYQKFNYEMKYIRPPKGEYSERTVAYTNTLGYKTVMWSFAYDDWDKNKQGREEYGKKMVLSNIHPGAVILLHATSKDNSNILDDCIKEIKQMGYEFRSLDQFQR